MECRKYTEKVQYITTARMHQLDLKCNGYVAVNIGDTTVFVNNKQLLPPPGAGLSGESTGVIGNAGEIFTGTNGTLPITFATTPLLNPRVMIVEKIYLE